MSQLAVGAIAQETGSSFPTPQEWVAAAARFEEGDMDGSPALGVANQAIYMADGHLKGYRYCFSM